MEKNKGTGTYGPPENKVTKIVVKSKTTQKAILEANNKGIQLVFDLESFKELPEAVLNQLSYKNTMAYQMTRNASKKVEESSDLSPLPAYAVTPEYASASAQLVAKGQDPKFHYCFKRPDEIGACRAMGYVFAKDPKIQCFNRDAAGVPIVGVAGNVELVLMKIPIEKYRALRQVAEDESKKRDGAVADTAGENIKKQGLKVVKGV